MHLEVLLNDLEKEATKELVNLLDENLDTSNNSWWQFKVIKCLSPIQQQHSIKNDINSLDLSALINVFSYNYSEFLTQNVFKGHELRSLALTIRSIRNSIAHQSMSTSFTSDMILYFLITYKIFLNKIHDINNVDKLLIIEDINKELLIQMERYQEAHGQPISTQNESKTNDTKEENKTLSYLEKIINDLDQIKSNKQEIITTNENMEETEQNINEAEKSDNYANENKIDSIEARDLLIGLREDIRRIYPDIPRENGILRIDMLQLFITKKINKIEKFNLLPNELLEKTNKKQLDQLEKIFSIINRINY